MWTRRPCDDETPWRMMCTLQMSCADMSQPGLGGGCPVLQHGPLPLYSGGAAARSIGCMDAWDVLQHIFFTVSGVVV